MSSHAKFYSVMSRSGRQSLGRLAGFVVLALCAGAAACGPQAEPAMVSGGDTERASSPSPAFVGRQACVGCHAAQDQQWSGSHHDRAMQVATDQSVLADFADATYTGHGITTRFFRRGDEFWVNAESPDGEPRDYRVAYTFGFEPLQQFLLEFENGRYQAFNVAWDARPASEGGQRWFDLQPDDRYGPGDPLHWTGVAYNWNYMCADCHSTDLRKNYDFAADAYATSFSEVNVSCEACHGPASAHVEWAESLPPGSAAGGELRSAAQMGLQVEFPRISDHSWNIDPESGLADRVPAATPAGDVEACGRCHSRRGRIGDDYRHGGDVADTFRVALLEEGLYHPDGQILDEVFVYGSFRQSRMYQAGVGCSDCHQPHSGELYNEGNALCNRCHLGPKFDGPQHHHHEVGTEGAACVSCHMPATTYMVVDPRRDHSFRVPRPDLSLTLGVPNACADCHAERGDRWAADAVVEWFGPERSGSFGATLAAARATGPAGNALLQALAGDVDAPAITRGTALSLLPPTTPAAIATLSRGLADPDSLVRRGALEPLEGADPATVMRLVMPLLQDPALSVRLEATRLIAGIAPPQIPVAERPAVAAAFDEFRRAQQVNADRASAHVNLGWLALQQGDLVEAETEYLIAIRLEPMFVPGYVNLADLYRQSGRDAEGEQVLRRALEIDAAGGEVHYALGLLLIRQDRLPEATVFLQAASRRSDANPHYLYVYAVAVQAGGDTAAALTLLDEGIRRFPGDRELLLGAAAFSRDSGDIDRAIGYAQQLVAAAPNDPQMAAFLRELELLRRLP